MSGKEFSDALSDISDDKIEAAANMTPVGRQRIWIRIAAVAAVLAILLTALLWPAEDEAKHATLGFIKVYAYDTTSGSDIESMDKFELTGLVNSNISWWIPYGSLVQHMPLTLECDASQYENETITFSVSANWGKFLRQNDFASLPIEDRQETSIWETLGTEFNVANGETIWYDPLGKNEDIKEVIERDGGAFADVLIYAGDHLIGYVVIEFVYYEKTPAFIATVKGVECFPMIDGAYQKISEEEIKERITDCKQEAMAKDD